jgi:hypothetical protein
MAEIGARASRPSVGTAMDLPRVFSGTAASPALSAPSTLQGDGQVWDLRHGFDQGVLIDPAERSSSAQLHPCLDERSGAFIRLKYYRRRSTRTCAHSRASVGRP